MLWLLANVYLQLIQYSTLKNRTYFCPVLVSHFHKSQCVVGCYESLLASWARQTERHWLITSRFMNVHDSRKTGNPQNNLLLNSCPDMIDGVRPCAPVWVMIWKTDLAFFWKSPNVKSAACMVFIFITIPFNLLYLTANSEYGDAKGEQ